jgi:hypothetical protein
MNTPKYAKKCGKFVVPEARGIKMLKHRNGFTSFDISLSSATRAFAVFSIPRVISTGFAPAATTYKMKFHSK